MRFTERRRQLLLEHGAEAVRECGVLWLVFAMLDKVVAGSLTMPWMLWNFSGSVAVWAFGMYIETKRQR